MSAYLSLFNEFPSPYGVTVIKSFDILFQSDIVNFSFRPLMG